ncbi:helix-turn-helix transcriptional regulator [Rhodococcus erythropolis]|uniref:helix-turn-helix domain-containing protein n=1 Tax=Rhodococcus erythropolis TaxID=1833 RepID=UPI0012464B26|nr:helix-turn-helix transcriptional regulator [Rhodococcus erythropolis]QEX12129.1 helix-turn-helix transcriptional regulator [Rhodococcus erythropolis]
MQNRTPLFPNVQGGSLRFMQESNSDLSAPGTYGEIDPGGGPYDEATGLREWYYADANIRFGQWLSERRKMLGISQQEIADRLTAAGIKFHDSSVARIEKGKRRVTVDEAEVISRILGVDINYMTSLERPHDLQTWIEEQSRNRLRRRPGNGEA